MLVDASSTGASNPLDAMTSFATVMLGLSVATERVTETIKQWIGPSIAGWQPQHNAAFIQAVAIVSGIFVTALSGLNPLKTPDFQPYVWGHSSNWLSWIVGGMLVSGGSAVWNHMLDILRAAKVQKEDAANAASAAVGARAIAP
ncbi:MAG TPA: hypothetical protein VG893_03620 [Terracidiphilus sp.]|nr:hypothetical protein [Terracidiphilus sp.]